MMSAASEIKEKKYARAVWKEDDQEEEGVVPSVWIRGDTLFWPPSNALKAFKERKLPGEKWLCFDLIKVKFCSDNEQECEEYNLTTTVEDSDSSDEEVAKRKSKKKKFKDYVLDDDEEASPAKQPKTNTKEIISTKSKNAVLPAPPEKLKDGHHASATSSHSDTLGSRSSAVPLTPKRPPAQAKQQHPRRSPRFTIRSPHSSPRLQSDSEEYDSPRVHRTLTFERRGLLNRTLERSLEETQSQLMSQRPLQAARRTLQQLPDFPDEEALASGMIRHRETPTSEGFPMPEGRFQRKVLMLLTEIRDSLKRQAGHNMDATNSGFIVEQCNTLEEFDELESELEDSSKRLQLKSQIRKIGGVDATDHAKRAMLKVMSNALMANFNLTGKNKKRAFKETKFCKIIQGMVSECHKDVDDRTIDFAISKFLKYAPERQGGGGRKSNK